MPNSFPVPPAHLFDLLLDAVCAVDRDGQFVQVSAACESIFGYRAEEMIGRSMFDFIHPDDVERTRHAALDIMQGARPTAFENRYLRKDGAVAHVMWSARWSENDQLRVAVARDISQSKRQAQLQDALLAISEAAHNAESLDALCAQIHAIVNRVLPAEDFHIALCNEVDGGLHYPYIGARSAVANAATPPWLETFSRAVLGANDVFIEDAAAAAPRLGVRLQSVRGPIGALGLQLSVQGGAVSAHDQQLLRALGDQVAQAILRQRSRDQLQNQALYDPLTDLPNRKLLHDHLRRALARARRQRSTLALLYFDLDDFKQINDRFGHGCGDLLLQAVAQRMQHNLRESDLVARLGGDEFVLLLEGGLSAADVEAAAQKLIDQLARPLQAGEQSLSVRPSIGIAQYPCHGHSEAALLRAADQAMYQAKRAGGARFCWSAVSSAVAAEPGEALGSPS